jgi:hypothetical protein
MHVERVVSGGQSGRYFLILGRSKPEIFSARLMDGSTTLKVVWTESLGLGMVAIRLAQVQRLAGGSGSITQITGVASDKLQELIRLGRFKADKAAQRLGQHLGGRWGVEVTPRPNSTTWNLTATLLGG